MSLNRRRFLQTSLMCGASGILFGEAAAQSGASPAPSKAAPFIPNNDTVVLVGDAEPVTPAERVRLLSQLMSERNDVGDNYLQGSIVRELEQKMAVLTGKEDCAFLATGTLANNLALRVLCGESKHAIVQEQSHIYRDESDSPGILSGITLVPIAENQAAPRLEQVAAAVERAEKGPYPIPVGAISLESPVRRQNGAGVPLDAVNQIAELARSKGIAMHLDGARLFLFSGLPDFDLQAYTAPFDTVYISLYKYFGAPFGAVLAGSKEHIAKVRDLRHIFGGTIAHGWEPALYALQSAPGFATRFAAARRRANELLAGLQQAGFGVQFVPDGSNIYLVDIPSPYRSGLRERLQRANIIADLRSGDAKATLYINESILRQPADSLVRAFVTEA